MRRTSWGGGGKGWGQETGKETAESKNDKQEMCCKTLNLFSLPLSHIQRNKSFHPILVFQSQEP